MVSANEEIEIKIKERLVYIVVCWQFDILRDYLRKIGFPEHLIPKNLTEKQARAEMNKMKAFFES